MKPLMLDLTTANVLVIGSGAVGTRKAAYFKDVCEVVIVDELPKNLAESISPYSIIIAATASAEVNERICREAATQNKWYNSATGMGNFLIPAAYQEGGFTLAVSTSGRSPAAAAFIRDKIRETYPALPAMIELQETVRAELKEIVPTQERRAEILREILEDENIWAALDSGDSVLALDAARRLYEH